MPRKPENWRWKWWRENAAMPLSSSIDSGVFGVRLDVREHAREALLVALDGRRKLFAFTHGPHDSRARARAPDACCCSGYRSKQNHRRQRNQRGRGLHARSPASLPPACAAATSRRRRRRRAPARRAGSGTGAPRCLRRPSGPVPTLMMWMSTMMNAPADMPQRDRRRWRCETSSKAWFSLTLCMARPTMLDAAHQIQRLFRLCSPPRVFLPAFSKP